MENQDEYGRTELHVAVEDNDFENVKRLVNDGINITKKDYLGRTALYSSVLHSHKEISKFLRGIHRESHSLHESAENDSVLKAMELLQEGEDVNKLDDFGRSPIHMCAHMNSKHVAKLLILRGADVNIADDYGRTSLHKCGTGDSVEVAELLIKHGAEVNAKNKRGNTPLHVSALKNSLKMIKLLLKNGAKIEEPGLNNMTPLHKSCDLDNWEACKYLLDNGADVTKKTRCGLDVIGYAIAKKAINCIKILSYNK